MQRLRSEPKHHDHLTKKERKSAGYFCLQAVKSGTISATPEELNEIRRFTMKHMNQKGYGR